MDLVLTLEKIPGRNLSVTLDELVYRHSILR
jgi:hypothetical protein